MEEDENSADDAMSEEDSYASPEIKSEPRSRKKAKKNLCPHYRCYYMVYGFFEQIIGSIGYRIVHWIVRSQDAAERDQTRPSSTYRRTCYSFLRQVNANSVIVQAVPSPMFLRQCSFMMVPGQ